MAAKKQVVSDADKASVLKAFDSAMHPDVGLTATQIGWKCNQSGRVWAESILEVLLSEKKVVFDINCHETERYPTRYWRLP